MKHKIKLDESFIPPDEKFMTISEVSQRLQIPKYTLRFWEKVFSGILSPLKTSGGQRRYSNKDLILIEEIQRMKAKGMSLSEIKDKLVQEIKGKNSNLIKVDCLAHRIAEMIKLEVYQILKES